MAKTKREQCPVVYSGASYPALHGTRCDLKRHPHPNERHHAEPNGKALYWWTEEAKAARAFTVADAATAQRIAPRSGIDVQAAIAQTVRDERMGERARCTRVIEATLDICTDPVSRAALQFASSMINAKQSVQK